MATLSDLYGHLKTLVEQWVYNKTQMNTRLDGGTEGNVTFAGKVDKESGKGLSSNDYTTTEKNKLAGIEAQANKITVDSALSSTSTNPLQNKAINTALSNKADSSSVPTKTSDLTNDGADGTNVFVANNDSRLSDARTPTVHTHSSEDVLNGDSLANIISLGEVPDVSNQRYINIAIDTALGTLSQIKALEVVSTLPTPSASTMGMLYIINESNKINFYYTEYDEPHDAYDWHKMDTDILDELVVRASDVTDVNAHSNIGSSANATQGTINGLIDSVLATKITKSNSATGLLKDDGTVMTSGTGSTNWAIGNHSHNYLTSDGKITQTITNNGNLVVTNSTNQVGVQSAIDVLDGVVNQLITYGSS